MLSNISIHYVPVNKYMAAFSCNEPFLILGAMSFGEPKTAVLLASRPTGPADFAGGRGVQPGGLLALPLLAEFARAGETISYVVPASQNVQALLVATYSAAEPVCIISDIVFPLIIGSLVYQGEQQNDNINENKPYSLFYLVTQNVSDGTTPDFYVGAPAGTSQDAMLKFFPLRSYFRKDALPPGYFLL